MRLHALLGGALLGLTTAFLPPNAQAQDQMVRILEEGRESTISVPMNRAMVVESDIPFAEVSIANAGIADISSLSERTIYILGKTPGRTTMTLLDPTGRLISNVTISVSTDVSEFKERLNQILPDETIEVRTANDGIVLSGTVSSVARLSRAMELAERYAPGRVSNLMSVGGVQQVMLKVRFAEMNRSVAKDLGATLNINGQTSDLAFRLNTGADTGNFGTTFLGFNIGSFELGVTLEALETKGALRTLAEPNLTALSGQEASFLAGGEYPIPVAQEDGVFTVEYKPFGIELNFIPRVVDGDLINLEVSAAVSAVDPNVTISNDGLTIQGFSRREATTTVEMRDGDSFAVAGLIRDEFLDNASQVPWIGDVPVIGALFRSAEYQRRQSELVIIVTSHLVTPTRGEALALPTDRIRPPSEASFFLRGKMLEDNPNAALPTAAGEVARQDFSGSYGYVLD
ncbi:MAG: type II and III secretion system protein family protein [Rhodobacteraceae bacterium]|nr:type II and III secretion system protein family protein [Paracoccaceae bacterium]